MNIPDEVIEIASKRLWFNHISDHWGKSAPEIWDACEEAVRTAAPVITEWARKEALREASQIAEDSKALGVASAIRALTEGDN